MLFDKIQKDLTNAMKAKNILEMKVLRFILSELKYKEIDKKGELTDEDVISLLQKECKKRKEAIEMFVSAGRTETVDDEKAQINVIERYLPKQMSEEDLRKIVKEVISEFGSANIGKVIGLVIGKTKGQADGATVSKLVKEAVS